MLRGVRRRRPPLPGERVICGFAKPLGRKGKQAAACTFPELKRAIVPGTVRADTHFKAPFTRGAGRLLHRGLRTDTGAQMDAGSDGLAAQGQNLPGKKGDGTCSSPASPRLPGREAERASLLCPTGRLGLASRCSPEGQQRGRRLAGQMETCCTVSRRPRHEHGNADALPGANCKHLSRRARN